MGFVDDIQRSFYSGCFGGHGMKLHALILPNGFFGSVYIGPIRVSDAGLMNMSGLHTYLSQLYREFSIQMSGDSSQFLPSMEREYFLNH